MSAAAGRSTPSAAGLAVAAEALTGIGKEWEERVEQIVTAVACLGTQLVEIVRIPTRRTQFFAAVGIHCLVEVSASQEIP